jgi:hypothetical protein
MTNNKQQAKPAIDRRELPAMETAAAETTTKTNFKGNFICLNTLNIKGTRLNLDSLESYGPSTDTTINLSRATGKIVLDFASKEERDEMLARIDSYCL